MNGPLPDGQTYWLSAAEPSRICKRSLPNAVIPATVVGVMVAWFGKSVSVSFDLSEFLVHLFLLLSCVYLSRFVLVDKFLLGRPTSSRGVAR